jgi:hypothetical protein
LSALRYPPSNGASGRDEGRLIKIGTAGFAEIAFKAIAANDQGLAGGDF